MNRLNEDILEKFITQNREKLDGFDPPAEMWQNISAELDKHEVVSGELEEDKLETFVRDNQAAFNLFEPPAELWQKISGELEVSSDEQVLESFVTNHKNSLDMFEPPADIWQKIAGELEDTQEDVPEIIEDNQGTLLEQFVTEHKEDLQLFEPPVEMWQKVSAELETSEKGKVVALSQRSLWRVTSVAAAIVLVGFVGFKLWGGSSASNPGIARGGDDTTKLLQEATADLGKGGLDLKTIDPELAEAESYYTEKIAEKKKALDQYNLDDLALKEEFKGDISELDSTYRALKKELYTVPGKEKVSEAMILNLQTRIEILNQQLKILEKTQKEKGKKQKKNTKNNEKMDI
ncbi:hypothetical protein BKI52_32380 [marine bacterium AO1-C]|nr:hypothetical protein BKI52_32380 [marine bacterium AO1-C]